MESHVLTVLTLHPVRFRLGIKSDSAETDDLWQIQNQTKSESVGKYILYDYYETF